MIPFPKLRGLAAGASIAMAALAACAQAPRSETKDIRGELNEPTLYEFLLGEIALQRGETALAARTYIDLAKRTRDPRVARRAVEVASQGKQNDLAVEAAKVWNDIEPGSAQTLQVLAALLINAQRVDEAEPYLQKLLVAEGGN